MSLTPTTRLGPYEIQAPIGAGGMGEVYRARDTRLNRTVALKVLSGELIGSVEGRERFEREARTIASLHHPHICVVHDVGEHDGSLFLVMEYLEGHSLAERLRRGPLPLASVLRNGIEIADALAKAHRIGVTHRDVKPANIMLTPDGSKLLDFGLAKLKQEVGHPDLAFASNLPPTRTPLTQEGALLGTLQYMAPEQVEGRIGDIDGRTDIFSLGAVIYEMTTGTRAFDGSSQASIIAKILEREPPPMSTLQPMTPRALDQAVRRCLAKDANDRWQSASDLAWELRRIAESAVESPATVAVSARPRTMFSSRLGWIVAAIASTAAVVLAISLLNRSTTPQMDAVRFFISPPGEATVSFGPQLAMSPDGTRVVFPAADASGKTLLWVRPLDSASAQPLPDTEGANGPFWSPDSRSIGFFVRGKMRLLPVGRGAAQTVTDAYYGRGATWNRDGIIVFGQTTFGGLSSIPARGGSPTPVTTLDTSRGERAHRWPQFLPDGRHFLYQSFHNDPNNNGIYIGSLDSKETRRLIASNLRAEYAAPGYLLSVDNRTLLAQPFDADRLQAGTERSIVADGLFVSTSTSGAGFSASQNGVLAYWAGGNMGMTNLLWLDRSGKEVGRIDLPGLSRGPELSPDQKKIALDVGAGYEPNDLWIVDIARNISTRFTTDPASDRQARWSPDSSRLVFHSGRRSTIYDLYMKPSEGMSSEQLVYSSGDPKYPHHWSPDGRFVAYSVMARDAAATADIWILPLSDRKPFPFLKTAFQETQARFSPDVRSIAYVSNESGTDEVYIAAFPTAGDRVRVSVNGGVQPRWRKDGRELFYLSADRRLMAVPINPTSLRDVGVPKPLFDLRFEPRGSANPYAFAQYDVSADGQRFLVNTPVPGATVPITVVLNWTAALKK